MQPIVLRPVAPPVEYGITKRLARAGNAAIALLRSLGTSAHVWLPGANGVSVASLPSENYLLSDFSTGYAGVDAVVGGVKDAMNPSGGISLTQPTTANKPLVRSGMLNLASYSYDLTNGVWTTVAATKTINTVTLTALATSQLFRNTIDRIVTVPNATYTMAALLSTSSGTVDVRLSRTDGTTWATASVSSTITVTTTPTLHVLTFVAVGAVSSDFVIGGELKTPFVPSAGTITVNGCGLFPGSWTAAQILAEGGIPVTTATAASNPSAGKYWWSFDGSNDSLLSGNLGITTACTIVMSLRVNSLAATQIIFAEDTNGVQVSIATNGAVSLTKTGGAALVTTAAGVVVAGVPLVLTARLSAGTADIRKSGAQSATAASALTFSAATGARIGTAFDGTTSPTGGALGWVVPLPTALSDADCLTVERLVAANFPNGPVF